MTWVIPPVRGLIDPTAAPIFVIDDIGAIWLQEGVATVYYYRTEPDIHGGEDQKIVDVIIKRKGASLLSSFAKVATFAQVFMAGIHGDHPLQPALPPEGFTPPRLVK